MPGGSPARALQSSSVKELAVVPRRSCARRSCDELDVDCAYPAARSPTFPPVRRLILCIAYRATPWTFRRRSPDLDLRPGLQAKRSLDPGRIPVPHDHLGVRKPGCWSVLSRGARRPCPEWRSCTSTPRLALDRRRTVMPSRPDGRCLRDRGERGVQEASTGPPDRDCFHLNRDTVPPRRNPAAPPALRTSLCRRSCLRRRSRARSFRQRSGSKT